MPATMRTQKAKKEFFLKIVVALPSPFFDFRFLDFGTVKIRLYCVWKYKIAGDNELYLLSVT